MLKLTGSLRVLVSSNTLRIPEASMCRIRSAIQRSGDLDIQSVLRLMNRKIEQERTEGTEKYKGSGLSVCSVLFCYVGTTHLALRLLLMPAGSLLPNLMWRNC